MTTQPTSGSSWNHWSRLRRWNPAAQEALDWACEQFPGEYQSRGIARGYYEYLWNLDEIVKKLGGRLNGARVADLGCGAGVLPLALSRLGARVLAVDRFEEYEESLNNQMGTTQDIIRRLERNNIETIRHDFVRAGIPGREPFDLVTCFAVLEHLPQSPATALRNMHDSLARGGFVFLTTPNIAWVRNRLRLLRGKTVHFPLEMWWRPSFSGHVREYTQAEMRTMLEWTGFTDIDTKVKNWAHMSSRVPAAESDGERWTTRFTWNHRERWVVAASLLLTAPFPKMGYSILASARRNEGS